ncbi:uncharacterized protein [Periplaneta americana]|uniref:uncharacterized protein isoform X2 n=1 Tax=Periplaneta americana TaxID=6978 RepID=UPI0037E7C862
MLKTLFLYLHYRQICQSYATASSMPSLQSTWIHFIVYGTNWTTGLMSAGSQGEHTSSTYKIQDQYKMIMSELKQELAKTEVQCTDLHRQIDYITKRREELKNEVLKEQQTYQEILDCLCKELLSREESCKASRTDTVSTNNEEEAETVHQEGIEV